MATAANKTANTEAAPVNFSDLVKGADKLQGHDLVDKGELIGVEFVITEVMFKTNDQGVSYAYVTCVNAANEMFEFNDSSGTGVRQQLIEYLHDVKNVTQISMNSGEIHTMALHVPRGLRVSVFEIDTRPNKAIGKPMMKTVRSYYLTKGAR